MDVSGFYVRYRDPRDGSWSEKWEEQQFPPAAVEYTVVFGERDGRFPPLVITRPVDIPVAAVVAAGGIPIPGQTGLAATGNATNPIPSHSFGSITGGASSMP
jgi:hypothetical protein